MTLRESVRLQRVANAYKATTGATIMTREGRRKPRGWQRYDFHPLAEVVPRHTITEIRAIASSLLDHGVMTPIRPITMYEGKILDGRLRAYLADTLSTADRPIILPMRTLADDDDPRRLLMQVNVIQRHITSPQQMALVKDRHFNAQLKS